VGRRRQARELALQLLYELDVRGEADLESVIAAFWARQPAHDEVREFADRLVRGVKGRQPEIDELIAKFAEHWELDRMAVVDRNVLRAGIWELLWGVDVPPKVAINEALEIARRFSTEESTRFINGLLDRVRRELCP
jgi:transcription antitermination factor NusB